MFLKVRPCVAVLKEQPCVAVLKVQPCVAVLKVSANLASAVAACMPQTRDFHPQSESVSCRRGYLGETMRYADVASAAGLPGFPAEPVPCPGSTNPRRKAVQPGLR